MVAFAPNKTNEKGKGPSFTRGLVSRKAASTLICVFQSRPDDYLLKYSSNQVPMYSSTYLSTWYAGVIAGYIGDYTPSLAVTGRLTSPILIPPTNKHQNQQPQSSPARPAPRIEPRIRAVTGKQTNNFPAQTLISTQSKSTASSSPSADHPQSP